jgi:hypothetical protein
MVIQRLSLSIHYSAYSSLYCFVIALIGLYCDYKDARQKSEEKKRNEIRKALREAVKRLNPEYTEEQIDMWINGK